VSLTGLVETEVAVPDSRLTAPGESLGSLAVCRATANDVLVRAGLALARYHLGHDLTRRTAVVVGAGRTGRHAARLLDEAGVGCLSTTSRRQAAAADLATWRGGQPLAAAGLVDAVSHAEILVAAISATAPVVLVQEVRIARQTARGRPLFVLDLGAPPDVEPAVGRLPGVVLIDLRGLGRRLRLGDVSERISARSARSEGRVSG
jgi:glutamyl-tRNA reductase